MIYFGMKKDYIFLERDWKGCVGEGEEEEDGVGERRRKKERGGGERIIFIIKVKRGEV